MIEKDCSTENPREHWEFIECKNKVALDLGCGRWESVEYRDPDWYTTPDWLVSKGASHVYAYDIDSKEIEWYNNNVTPYSPVTAIHRKIDTVDTLREILNTHNPKVVKCDIEGAEVTFLELTDEEFSRIEFYALETHSNELYDSFMNKFKTLQYEIIAVLDLTHAKPMKAIFAKKV